MKRYSVQTLAIVGVLLATTSLLGHHAAQAQFDLGKVIVLDGTCTRVEWINPHAYIHLEVKNKGGQVKRWELETVGPQALRRAGLTRGPNGIRVGQRYTVRGFPSRNGSDMALVADITMPDGRVVTVLDVSEFQLPADFKVPR